MGDCDAARLEEELRAELQDARVVRRTDMQKAITTQRVVADAAGRAAIAGDVSPLGVVEDVKGLRTKLESHLLLDRKALEQRPVKIGAARVVQDVPASRAKRQTARLRKSRGVAEGRSETFHELLHDARPRVAHQVWTGGGAQAVSHTGVVCGNDGTVRRTGLESGDPGELPSAQDLVGKTRALEERQIPNVAEVEDVSLVEVRTGAICAGIE